MTPAELDDLERRLETGDYDHLLLANCRRSIAQLRADLAATAQQRDAAIRSYEAITEQIAPLKADAAALRALLRRWRDLFSDVDGYHPDLDADTARALGE